MLLGGSPPEADAGALAEAVLAAPARLGAVRVLAVDGPSGAGKSTLAAAVRAGLRARGVPVALVGTDEFATWTEPVAWWPRLAAGVLEPLARGHSGGYHRMDWTSGQPRQGAWIPLPCPQVLILEGVSAGRASIRPRLSHLCWVTGPPAAVRLARTVRRDGPGNAAELARWQDFERGWFAVDRTAEHATLPVTPIGPAQPDVSA